MTPMHGAAPLGPPLLLDPVMLAMLAVFATSSRRSDHVILHSSTDLRCSAVMPALNACERCAGLQLVRSAYNARCSVQLVQHVAAHHAREMNS